MKEREKDILIPPSPESILKAKLIRLYQAYQKEKIKRGSFPDYVKHRDREVWEQFVTQKQKPEQGILDVTRRRFLQNVGGSVLSQLMGKISFFTGTIVPVGFQKKLAERIFASLASSSLQESPNHGWGSTFLLSVTGYAKMWDYTQVHPKMQGMYDKTWSALSRNGPFQDLSREMLRVAPDFPIIETWAHADDTKRAQMERKYGGLTNVLNEAPGVQDFFVEAQGHKLMEKIISGQEIVRSAQEKMAELINLLNDLPPLIKFHMQRYIEIDSLHSPYVGDFIEETMQKHLADEREQLEKEVKKEVENNKKWDHHYHEDAILEERIREEKMKRYQSYVEEVMASCNTVIPKVRGLLGESPNTSWEKTQEDQVVVWLRQMWEEDGKAARLRNSHFSDRKSS